MKVLITTVPFAERSKYPLELLNNSGAEVIINPLGRKLKEDELIKLLEDVEIIVAGTEIISRKAMESAKKLKLISRVGIGLDGIDLVAAKELGINVSYTADAPAPAVTELTIGLLLTLLRGIHLCNKEMHEGGWNRIFGRRISEVTIGIIGAGRIGSRVIRRLKAFGTPRLLVNDLERKMDLDREHKIEWVTKEEIYKNCDVVLLHLPLTNKTKNLITKKELIAMKSDSIIINTSRGGIINEDDLYEVMKKGHLQGAALDVFINEPYRGKLAEIDKCILTSHMGSMSIDCRNKMELEASEEAVRYINGQPLKLKVPESEYQLKRT